MKGVFFKRLTEKLGSDSVIGVHSCWRGVLFMTLGTTSDRQTSYVSNCAI